MRRAKSVPPVVRHTPPKPPRMPEPAMVRVEAQRRAMALMSAAFTPVISSAQAGVLAVASGPRPRMWSFHSSKRWPCLAMYSLS